jgi:hypothetical protein
VAGGWLDSDDHNHDGTPDVARGTAWHVDFVYIDGMDAQGRSFYQRTLDKCFNWPAPMTAPCTVPYHPPITALDPTRNFRQDFTPRETVLAGVTPFNPGPPPTVLPIKAYDYTTGPIHYYAHTAVSPNPPWNPIASPGQADPVPCDTGETTLRWFTKNGQWTYTDEAAEADTLRATGWATDKAMFCTVPSGTPGAKPLYRVTKADGDRILTLSTAERDDLVANGATSKTLNSIWPPA